MITDRVFRRKRALTACLVGTGLLACAGGASATVVLPADFAEMVSESQLIVHGRVTDVRAQSTGDRQAIESVVTVTVTQSFKGDVGTVVVFRVPNGQLGRYRRVTVGAPEFRRGDEVVVFLKGRAPIVPMPYGLNQGVYRVQRLAGGRSLVTRAPVLSRTGEAEPVVRGDPSRRAISIQGFAAHVRAIDRGEVGGQAPLVGGDGAGALRPGADTGRPRPERQQ
jgi:hypothetical protein